MCLKADFVFEKWEQQQNAPARQQANVLQEKHQPGSLVVDVDQGGELNPRGDKRKAIFQESSCRFVRTHTHHVSQPHIQEKPRGDGSNPLFGGKVWGHGQGDVQADEGAHGAAEV